MKSPRFKLTSYNVPKIVKSAGIVVIALASLALIDFVYPGFNIEEYKTAILMGVSAFLVNLVKEWLEKTV